MRLLLIAMMAAMLGGCVTTTIGSTIGGECKLAFAPQYQVLGRTSYDQRWINNTSEALTVGCKQPRPKARPPELDKPQVAAVVGTAKAKPKGRIRRLLGV